MLFLRALTDKYITEGRFSFKLFEIIFEKNAVLLPFYILKKLKNS